MDVNLTHYYTNKNSLDSISITELENIIHLNPLDLMPKILLSHKLDSNDEQELLLFTNDRTFVHYLKSDDQLIPTIEQLKESLISHQDIPFNISAGAINGLVHDSELLPKHIEPELPSDVLVVKVYEVDRELDMVTTTEKAVETNDISSAHIDLEDEDQKEILGRRVKDATRSKEDQSILHPLKKNKKSGKKIKKEKYKLKEFNGISEYSKWLLSFTSSDIDKKIKKEQKIEKKRAWEESANKSVKKSNSIISDSLADLLASQGHFDESKKMYEQLMLKYPEKSSYFAAKINQIIKN